MGGVLRPIVLGTLIRLRREYPDKYVSTAEIARECERFATFRCEWDEVSYVLKSMHRHLPSNCPWMLDTNSNGWRILWKP